MSLPRLHVLTASTRPGRVGPAVAEWLLPLAAGSGLFDVHPVDLADFRLPLLDEPHHPSERDYTQEHTRRWSESVAAADAFVFVMPEYNYGISAALKNAIDYLYYEWQYKPVAFVSYGNTSAGLRAAQMAKQVVTTLRMFPLTEAVSIHFVGRSMVDGRFEGTEAHAQSAKGMFTELERVALALRPLRETAG